MPEIVTVGRDLAKDVFRAHGADLPKHQGNGVWDLT
jgi:hypothetical protein